MPRAPPYSATLRGASLLPEEGSKLLKFPSMEASPRPTKSNSPTENGGGCSTLILLDKLEFVGSDKQQEKDYPPITSSTKLIDEIKLHKQ